MASRALGHDALVGIKLGHYRIAEKIGAGGMGEVYRAQDEHLGRDVAIKVLPPGTLSDESARKRFRDEALILSKLNHPNIATIHDFDTQAGSDFLVMEYVPGVTLSERLAAGPLPEKEVACLGGQLADGLAAAHERGVIHRDLKPGNLRLTADGRLKILDFGLAKLVQPVGGDAETASLTETRALAGTLPYMAPEQLKGERVDTRSDLWAAGVALYEMATGRHPFEGKTSTAVADQILHAHARAPQELQPRLSPRLADIILKCLEKDAENRYQSAKELQVDLRRLSLPTSTASLGAVVTRKRTRSKRIRSVAVLPLTNFSRDPEQEYYADGMTEALICDLAKLRCENNLSHFGDALQRSRDAAAADCRRTQRRRGGGRVGHASWTAGAHYSPAHSCGHGYPCVGGELRQRFCRCAPGAE
jgi:eukaryotic-like serine/threonine-protein kinase